MLIIAVPAFAQTKGTAKLYAYKQRIIPGIIKKNIDDATGKEIPEPMKPTFNYFIYMVSTSGIYPEELWIEGKQYAVNIETINKTPVEFKRDNLSSPIIILVPKTTQKVIQLLPESLIEKTNPKSKRFSSSNELVIIYRINTKKYYQLQSKLLPLESSVLQ